VVSGSGKEGGTSRRREEGDIFGAASDQAPNYRLKKCAGLVTVAIAMRIKSLHGDCDADVKACDADGESVCT
jgi:hypothetical protein